MRAVLRTDPSGATFAEEVARFEAAYDGELGVYVEAARDWDDVERARGRGRLHREKAKQEEATLGTAVEV